MSDNDGFKILFWCFVLFAAISGALMYVGHVNGWDRLKMPVEFAKIALSTNSSTF